jgi:hypothetical protein
MAQLEIGSVHQRVGRHKETERLLAFLARQSALSGGGIETFARPESATALPWRPKQQPSSDWKRVGE